MKWTEEEIFYLKSNLDKNSSELSKVLSKNRRTIIKKIKNLGLINEYREHNYFLGKYSDEIKELERRNKISKSSKENRKSGGIRKGSGRGKKGTYKGYWCDSSYELAWVIYNIDKNIPFTRNSEKFKYIDTKMCERYFIPDFIIGEVYYEIKGFKNENVDLKIRYFPHTIKVLYKNDLVNIFNYVIGKYGKNFISLYEDKKYKSCSICGGYIYRYNKSGKCIKCVNKHNEETTSVESKKKLYNCLCGNPVWKKDNMCKECSNTNQRKVLDRPPIETLLESVKNVGYVSTGKIYGVSDNCIRKWIKKTLSQ